MSNRQHEAGLVESEYRAPWWLRSAHLQTIWGPLLRRGPRVALRRERLELPDGDFIDLDWTTGTGGPLVLILHGLEGSSTSHYARGLLAALHARGFRAVLMHFRGCSGEPNRLARSYHSGDSAELDCVWGKLREREPRAPMAAVGYSMGGNLLLKWLGEQGERAPIRAAVAVCVPFDLADAARRLERGASRIYQARLVGELRRKLERKFPAPHRPFDLAAVNRCRTFFEFDDLVTAPLHGFAGVDDYYARSSAGQFLHRIRAPTLIVHARDDPFMTPEVIPAPGALSPSIRLELSAHGGHVGFVHGRWPWRARYWLESRIPEFLKAHLTG
ncbi:MAG: hydrolase [Gammaproteobacteria bacterium]|nr:hydrolase [Gammaproteobacteria bacterium]